MNGTLPTISLVGAGRAGAGIARALLRAGAPVVGIADVSAAAAGAAAGPTPGSRAAALARELDLPLVPLDRIGAAADLCLVAVPDAAIGGVAAALAATAALPARACHLAGALDRSALAPLAAAGTATAAWHPMFAFGEGQTPDLAGVVFGIDAPPALGAELQRLTRLLGAIPVAVGAPQRPGYHAAAVIASNFSVTLAAGAEQLLVAAGLSPAQAHGGVTALLRSTLANLATAAGPAQSLTGPVVRGDAATIEAHLEAIAATAPDLTASYLALSRLTLDLARSSGRIDSATAAAVERALQTRQEVLT